MPSATSTLSEIGAIIVNTTVDLAKTIFTEYWPYLLIIGVIAGLVVAFKKLVGIGTK